MHGPSHTIFSENIYHQLLLAQVAAHPTCLVTRQGLGEGHQGTWHSLPLTPGAPLSRKETYLWLRDSVRIGDNRLKGGRSCLIRKKITWTIKLPLRKQVARRAWTPRLQTWMQTKVADFGRGAEQGLLPSVWRINQSSLKSLTVLSLWIWLEGFVTLTCQTTGCKSVAQQQVQPKSVFIWPTWYFFPSCLMKLYYGDNLNI